MDYFNHFLAQKKTNTMNQETDYIPYEEEWKKEISKLPKAAIIEIAAKIGKEKLRLEKLVSELPSYFV